MDLSTKEGYHKEMRLLYRLPIDKLKSFVAEMHKIRYDDNDIEIDAYYRLASHVLIQRKEDRQSLIFHLKNLVVGMIFISYLYSI